MSSQELTNRKNPAEPGGEPNVAGARQQVDPSWDRRLLGAMIFVLALLALLAAIPVAAANGDSYKHQAIVRLAPEHLDEISTQYGLTVQETLHGDEFLALVEVPESLTFSQVEKLLRNDARVLDVAPVELASLPKTDVIQPDMGDLTGDLLKTGDFITPCLAEGFSELLWSGFADQEAVQQIHLHEAHVVTGECGRSAVVAVLDTGVDPEHPLLAGAFIDGYDFVQNRPGTPSEWSSLDQSLAAILEQSLAAILEQSLAAILEGDSGPLRLESNTLLLDQSLAAILESDTESTPSFFGHGTMVAGLVRLAAPNAKIMPLRVFGPNGQAHLFDVVRAIYYAVDHGADVINMSFSMDGLSPELRRAVQYATKNGVVCVSSAGNQGERALVYPAAMAQVIGVASVDDADRLAEFSNYGSGLVSIAAPGNGIISAYPGGLYGAGWGTSFSTPLVAGAVALLRHHYTTTGTATVQEMRQVLEEGSEPLTELVELTGEGRLDVLGTLLAAEN